MIKRRNWLYEEEETKVENTEEGKIKIEGETKKETEEKQPRKTIISFVLKKPFNEYNINNLDEMIEDVANSFNKTLEENKDHPAAERLKVEFFSDESIGKGVWKGKIADIEKWKEFWNGVLKNEKPELFEKLWNKYLDNFYEWGNKNGVYVGTKPYEEQQKKEEEKKKTSSYGGVEIQKESLSLKEEWSSKKDVPANLKSLTLKQANYWAKVYDALIKEGKSEVDAAKIAWYQTRKKFNLKG